MHSVPREEQIVKINKMLQKTHQNITKMRLFGDTDQEDSLVSRGRGTHIDRQHIEQIAEAKQMIEKVKVASAKLQSNVEKTERKKILLPESSQQQFQSLPKEKKGNEQQSIFEKADQADSVPSKIESKSNYQIPKFSQSGQEPCEDFPIQIVEGELQGSLARIQVEVIKKYFKNRIGSIDAQMTGEAVYMTLVPFYDLNGITVSTPLIKKYKNCIYFGQVGQKDQTYEGFLLFPNEYKIYCGQLVNEKKNGSGIEIDFKNDVVYEGSFVRGRKQGNFKVTRPNELYIGTLKKGQYHGRGRLVSEMYIGEFANGMRHGEGEEKFKKMALTLKGTFVNNTFSNHQTGVPSTNSSGIKSRIEEKTRYKEPDSKVKNPEQLQDSKSSKSRLRQEKIQGLQPAKSYEQYDYQFNDEQPIEPLFQINPVRHHLPSKGIVCQRDRYSEPNFY